MDDIDKHASLSQKYASKITTFMADLHVELYEAKEVNSRESCLVIINAGTEALARFVHASLEVEMDKEINLDSVNFDIHKLLSEILAKYSGRTTFCAEVDKRKERDSS